VARTTINNIASVGIIYREADPRDIFIDMKDGGLPVAAFQWTLCPIGGNWVGAGAAADAGPLATFRREFEEEFVLRTVDRDLVEVIELGHLLKTANGKVISREDSIAFFELRQSILTKAAPWRDYLVPVSRRVLDLAPGNTREGFTTLVSYNLVGLDEVEWKALSRLQQTFENLSNESLSWVTSLSNIVALERRFAYGHEWAYRDFWEFHSALELTRWMRMFPHAQPTNLGKPRQTYGAYLEDFEVLKRP
jgi:hypothetical protein